MPQKWQHVIGIDPSLTGTAVAVIKYKDGSLVCVQTFTTEKKDFHRLERTCYIRNSVLRTIMKYREGMAPVFIEGYGFGCKGRAVFDLAGLGDAIRLSLVEFMGIAFYEIPPTLLKKFITGKGNSAKNIMLEKVYRKYGTGSETLLDDNQVDAFALAKFGRDFLKWKDGTPAKNCSKECFKKVGTPEKFDPDRTWIK